MQTIAMWVADFNRITTTRFAYGWKCLSSRSRISTNSYDTGLVREIATGKGDPLAVRRRPTYRGCSTVSVVVGKVNLHLCPAGRKGQAATSDRGSDSR
jgi:hypothetical protein